MNRKNVLFVWLLLIMVMSGCSSPDRITLEQVETAFKKHGVVLQLSECKKCFRLNGKTPLISDFSNGTIRFYVYKDEEDVQKAIDEFNKIKEKYNMVIPQIFTAGNILVFYINDEERTDSYLNRDKTILRVMDSLKNR